HVKGAVIRRLQCPTVVSSHVSTRSVIRDATAIRHRLQDIETSRTGIRSFSQQHPRDWRQRPAFQKRPRRTQVLGLEKESL
ncbi:hypothetical protein TRAPUB_14139, partial [Trametes pubescens]